MATLEAVVWEPGLLRYSQMEGLEGSTKQVGPLSQAGGISTSLLVAMVSPPKAATSWMP